MFNPFLCTYSMHYKNYWLLETSSWNHGKEILLEKYISKNNKDKFFGKASSFESERRMNVITIEFIM